MEKKKTTTIRLGDKALVKLKRFAADWDISIGDAITGMVEFTESFAHFKEAKFQKRFLALLDTTMLNVGVEAWWEGEIEKELTELAKAQDRQAAYQKIREDRKRFAAALGIVPGALD